MDIIASWIYLDRVGEESNFPQVQGKSSSLKFQETFWKCLVVFYESSLRFNKDKKHMLFTNTDSFPTIEGLNMRNFFAENNIEVVKLENEYPLPNGYYAHWNNQFYEFSILKYLSENYKEEYILLLLDSDCVFNTNVDHMFRELRDSSASSFTYATTYPEEKDINGISRLQMKSIFEDLGLKLDKVPVYSGGEVLFAKKEFIDELCKDFDTIWDDSMERFRNDKIKFNEEAHVLSYYYYKLNASIGKLDVNIKRCWTNPLKFRNVDSTTKQLDILHLPSEKGKGISNMFDIIVKKKRNLRELSNDEYQGLINYLLSPTKFYYDVPKLLWNKIKQKM